VRSIFGNAIIYILVLPLMVLAVVTAAAESGEQISGDCSLEVSVDTLGRIEITAYVDLAQMRSGQEAVPNQYTCALILLPLQLKPDARLETEPALDADVIDASGGSTLISVFSPQVLDYVRVTSRDVDIARRAEGSDMTISFSPSYAYLSDASSDKRLLPIAVEFSCTRVLLPITYEDGEVQVFPPECWRTEDRRTYIALGTLGALCADVYISFPHPAYRERPHLFLVYAFLAGLASLFTYTIKKVRLARFVRVTVISISSVLILIPLGLLAFDGVPAIQANLSFFLAAQRQCLMLASASARRCFLVSGSTSL